MNAALAVKLGKDIGTAGAMQGAMCAAGQDMEFSGVQEIAASRRAVWLRLNDPATIAQCLPGCERYDEIAPDRYEAVVVTSFGPLWLTLKGTVTVSGRVPARSYRLEAVGSGMAAGFGPLVASITLTTSKAGTRLRYSAVARVAEPLAQMGSQWIESTASRFLETFFTRFGVLVSTAG